MKKYLLILSLLIGFVVQADPVTLKGMPKSLQINSDEAELLVCQSMNSKILIFISQERESDEFGVVQVWSRQYERAKYPDIFDGNFDYPKHSTLVDRKNIQARPFKTQGLTVKFDKDNNTMKVSLAGKKFVADVNLEADCLYSYGEYDGLLNRFE